ncbi:male accessory gland serine protease inhibitor-like [Drosophila obscura]|uniref:male accessory gland serine protease inhibitor-like n=1 Tax=Drosophila obscura TaxID=7282 RepID=UPI001BB21061|nr:male accessory gland serine protease inhibitor-like [Drosophila obscura]
MNFISIAGIILTLFGVALGLKDPVCGQKPAADGHGKLVCLAYMPTYTYYPDSNTCKVFIYGGCGGNENHFPSQIACESKCKK